MWERHICNEIKPGKLRAHSWRSLNLAAVDLLHMEWIYYKISSPVAQITLNSNMIYRSLTMISYRSEGIISYTVEVC